MHAQLPQTPAEKALVDAFSEQIVDLPGDGVVATKRDAAIEAIKLGLPTRRVETWHYTDLRRLLTTIPALKQGDAPAALEPLLENSAVITLGADKPTKYPAIQGVDIGDLRNAFMDGSAAEGLGQIDQDDLIGAINTAFVAGGFTTTVAADTNVDKVIEFQHLHGAGQTHARFNFDLGNGSQAVVVERQSGIGPVLASSVSDVTLGGGSELLWIIVQEQPDDATHLAQFKASIGKDAKLTVFIMNTGGKLVRQEVHVEAVGTGSDFQLRTINLTADEAHVDVTMVVDHKVPDTSSRELIRNVLTDRSHVVFQGRINVFQIAQQTDAKMACDTLLLSDDADFSTKPELEIFADDVACGHGATVTDINADHLFYLTARGIPEKQARGLLVKAFLAEVIEGLEHEGAIEALEIKLDNWFKNHG